MKALFKRLFKPAAKEANISQMQKLSNIKLGESDNRWENQEILIDDVMVPEDIFSSLQQKGKKVDKTFSSSYDSNK